MNRSGRGFTLIELQIAMLLVAMISVLLLGGLRLATDTWDRVTDKSDVSEHRFLLAQAVRRHLDDMRFETVKDEDGNRVTVFYGDQQRLQYVAPFPGFDAGEQLYLWTLASEYDESLGSFQLYLEYVPFDGENSDLLVSAFGPLEYDSVPPGRLPLATGVVLAEAAYYAPDEDRDGEWLDRWAALDSTPRVLRLVLAEVDGEGRETPLPEIAVTPRFAVRELYGEGGDEG